MANVLEKNQELGIRINEEIWNNQRFDLIPELFTEDFVADYSPRAVREGRDQLEKMVRSAHATFEGFTETVHQMVVDEESIVIHFTISGKQVGEWGPLPATNRDVKFNEVVIMRVRNGKVFHQTGVVDNLLALQQMGYVADPAGFAKNSFK